MRLLLIAALLGAAAAFVDRGEWNDFKAKHGKAYRNVMEEMYRMSVYADNKAFVEQHNAEFAAGKKSFTVALNRMADLTNEEINQQYKGSIDKSYKQHGVHKLSNRQLPTEVDWRDSGIVTEVKDQGSCGSCWSFAATGSLEAAWAQAGNPLTTFSEQQLMDCSTENSGCGGGMAYRAFEYLERSGGIMTEDAYPYEARERTCRDDPSQYVGSLTSYVSVQSHGSAPILADAVSGRPVAVSIDASESSFNFYSGGVYDEPRCSSSYHNHAVLVVGYGTEDGKDYWLVKNSWGPAWGESGYIKMTRDSTDQCAIASIPYYPVV